MGHRISAILLRDAYDAGRARDFGLHPIPLPFGLTMFPLDDNFCDEWTEKLNLPGFLSARPLLNARVVHHLVASIAEAPLFAIIETDYFGGLGEQAAVVYQGQTEIMPPEVAGGGPINKALRHLGVVAQPGLDEFDTVGLGDFRDFDELFGGT